MLAQIYLHPAGSDWRAGSPIDAESVSLSAAAGVNPPAMSFNTSVAQRPRPREQHATLVIDGHPVETVFTPVQRGATMTGRAAFGGVSVSCMAAIEHLDEIATGAGWPHTSVSDLRTAALNAISTRPGLRRMSGINSNTFRNLVIESTAGAPVPPNAASIDPFGDELQSLLAAITRYAVAGGLPIDWWMDASRRLRAACPLRPAPNAPIDYIAGHNCDEITENIDLSPGRVASRVIVGTKGNSVVSEIPQLAGKFGDIDHVASSGSASAIVEALSSQLRTFGISIGSGRARVSGGVPSLWIGDRVRARNTDGEWSRCAIISASLAVDDGGTGVSINATAVEGDW